MKIYDEYVVVMPADQAIQVANTLANLGLALEGTTLEIGEGGDPLFRVGPRDIHEAWRAISDALQENWLGHGQRML